MADRSSSGSVRRSRSQRSVAPGDRQHKSKSKNTDRYPALPEQQAEEVNPGTSIRGPGEIPDFELDKELGRGRNGVVYRARQKSLDRIVAVKVLSVTKARNADFLSRFREEARAAAMLRHPNIAAMYHVGECTSGHFFVTEYIQGPTLQKVLELRGPGKPLPVSRAMQILIPIVQAVSHAHSRNIFHRDLTPSNVIVERPGGRPVLLDFGTVRRQDHFDPALTANGTPSYMSPEQASELLGCLSVSSDIHALGGILYFLLTGRAPYSAVSPLDTLLLVAGPTPVRPVTAIRADVPAEVNDICMKCLNKRPEDRYTNCDALVKELKAFLKSAQENSSATLRISDEKTGGELILELESSGKKLRLTRPETVIGRAPDCDLVIKRGDIGPQHCRILLGPEGAEVEDLGSMSGVFVNGERVTRHPLVNGDRLELAKYVFVVRL